MDSWEILEKKHSIDVLIQIYQNPGITQNRLADKAENGSTAKRERIKDLIDLGWIVQGKSPQHWSAICYYVTAEGERVCKLLLQIRDGDDHRTSVVHGTHQEDVSVTEKK